MIVYITLAVVVLLTVLLIVMYNSFIGLRNQADEAFSTMDVYLKKRYDLIPNLVETAKGYASHETETLERVMQARNMALSAQNFSQRQQNENMLSGALKSLFAVAESYPELRADGIFRNLQMQLQQLESDISQSRKYYNAVVKALNTKVEMFPANIIAGVMGFRKYPYFMVDDAERQNVQVKF